MYYYIINPAAGRGQVRTIQEKLRSTLDQLGIKGEWVKSTGPGEIAKLTAEGIGKGASTIVAIGGDDTVNEVINGVGNHDEVAIGIIPLGSTNRLATQLGITDWQQACQVLAARRLTPYSLIAAGQKFFLSTLTLGFETELDKAVDTGDTSLKARTGQLTRSLKHARRYQPLHCKIRVDDQFTLECDLFSLQIANQKFLNPLAENQLLVSLRDQPGKLQLGSYVWRLLRDRGSKVTEDIATTRFLASRVVIETSPVTGIMVDGKVTGRTPIAIRLTDRRIRFITEKIQGDFKAALGSKLRS